MKNNNKDLSYQSSSGFADTVSVISSDEKNVPIKKTDSFNISEKKENTKNTRQRRLVKSEKKDYTTLKNGQNLNQVVNKLYNRFNEGKSNSTKNVPVDKGSHENLNISEQVPTQSQPLDIPTVHIDETIILPVESVVEISPSAESVVEASPFAVEEFDVVSESDQQKEKLDSAASSKSADLIDENILIAKLAKKLKPHIKDVIYQKSTQAVKAKSKELLIGLNLELEKELPKIISQVLDENLEKIIKEYL